MTESRSSFWLVLVVGLGSFLAAGAVMLRTESFYGRLLRGWDAQFYYAAAVSLVKDRDLDLTNQMENTPYPEPFDPDGDGVLDQLPRQANGRVASKYPGGLSLIEAPFVALGSLLSPAGDSRAPGYRRAEILTTALGLAGLFALGMAVLTRLVLRLLSAWWTLVAVGSACAGTSLMFYASIYPFMAHAAGFTLVTLIVERADGLGRRPGSMNGRLLLLGVLGGLLFLVRPQQVLLGVFVALWKGPTLLRRPPREWLAGMLGLMIAMAGAVGYHMAANHAQFGAWSLNPYSAGGEGFDWRHPDFETVLVGQARGLLVYSPVVGVALLGFAVGARRAPGFAWVLLLHAVAQVYLVACWSSPDQGQAFGGRMFVECSATVACGVALWLAAARPGGWRWAAAAIVAVCVAWSLVLMAGYVRAPEGASGIEGLLRAALGR